MKNKLVNGLMIFGLGALLFTSCAKVPQAEVDAANAAIEEARVAGADVYLSENYTALQDSMKVVMEVIETQKSKVFKSFSGVPEKLSAVSLLAVQLKDSVSVRKAEIKAEVEALIAETIAVVEDNKVLVTKAPKGKEGAVALDAIKLEIEAVETSVSDAQNLLGSDQLLPALDKIKAAKEKASSINEELNGVIAKTKSYKKG